MTILKVITTPNPTLKQKSRHLEASEIKSSEVQKIVQDIRDTLKAGQYGVGMSAIQIGKPLALAVVMIRPTPTRPNLERFNKVYFNAKITTTQDDKTPMWEGCCSVIGQDGKPVYAKVPRFEKISMQYLDENGMSHEENAEGFLAQVLQHEIDHQNGILFTDLVSQSEIISFDQYQEIVNSKRQKT